MTRRHLFALALIAILIGSVSSGAAAFQSTEAVAEETVDGESIPPETIDAAVSEVLSRSAYAGQRGGLFDFLTDNPVTRFLAERWQRFVEWLNSFFEDDEPASPTETSQPDSGRSSFGVPLLIGVALITALLAARLARRRTQLEEFEFTADPHAGLNTSELATEADRAASAGDHELSVRLRFKSGLLTLDRRGIIEYDETEPLGTVRRAVNETDFDTVADGFERVTYSDHEADKTDSESAESGWSRVLNRIRSGDDT